MKSAPKEFLCRFGFCTPEQWAANEKHGWDDESSAAFFVWADDESAALSLGRLVAEAFNHYLFQQAGWGEIPSWEDAQFAAWIETTPTNAFTDDVLNGLPRVKDGETPDFARWLGRV